MEKGFRSSILSVICHPAFVAMIIVFMIFSVFIQVLGHEFVRWDDDIYIYQNQNLGGLNIDNLLALITNSMRSSSWYTPLAGLRWSATYQLFGLNPAGYHLGNLLFHTTNAILLFVILRKLLLLNNIEVDRNWLTIVAALAALIWAIHPMRVEPVASAAGGAYPQAVFFMFLSLLYYLRHANSCGLSGPHGFNLTISVVLYVAAILSQPVTLGFAAVPLLLDFYPLRRIGGETGWWRMEVRNVLLEKIPYFGVAVIFAAVSIGYLLLAPDGGHQSVGLSKFSLLSRLMQALYVVAYYVYRPFYPLHLSPVYSTLVSFNPLSLPFVMSAIVVVGSCFTVYFVRKRWPVGVVLLGIYLALLMPVVGVFEHPYYTVDRYSLVPSICFSIGIAWLIIKQPNKNIRALMVLVTMVAINSLVILSYKQTMVWRTSETLFSHMIETLGDDPYRADVYLRLGKYYYDNGQHVKSADCFKQTLDISPNNVVANAYLARISYRNGDLP